MKRIEIFQVDTFTNKVFHGAPSVVCLLHEKLNDELLQAIAIENRVSETVFVLEQDDGLHIRWFTPKGELDLCGKGTLSAAFLMFELRKVVSDKITFKTSRGLLTVLKTPDRRLAMMCPLINITPINHTVAIQGLVQSPVLEYFESIDDYVFVLQDERAVLSAQVDLKQLLKLPKRGLILTSKSFDTDFHSRCFYPKYGVIDDAATPFAYGILAQLWSKRLNQTILIAEQGALRRGEVYCQIMNDAIQVSGHCKWYSKGYLMI